MACCAWRCPPGNVCRTGRRSCWRPSVGISASPWAISRRTEQERLLALQEERSLNMEPEQMVESLRAAAAGKVIISDALTHVMAAALRDQNRPETPREADLTEQEVRILERIAAGMSNKLIGKELDIAEGTVKVHVKHILRKLSLRSRVEAAVWAVAHPRKGKA